MKDKPTNLPASVLARLRNTARAKNTDYQLILRRYAIERLLHRLSISPHRDQFVLKGAMLFTAWLEDPFRPTQDLDLLGYGDPATSSIKAAFRTICKTAAGTAAEDDGLVFDADGLSVELIREDQQYGGVRVKTVAFLGNTRIPVQVDIGFGDAITPAAQELEFPPLLSSEGPRLKAYPKETVVAEKLQAIVALGRANSRMKISMICLCCRVCSSSMAESLDQPFARHSVVEGRSSLRCCLMAFLRNLQRIRRNSANGQRSFGVSRC